MANWHFWGEKQFSDVYENIYIRTSMEDWFGIVDVLAKEISGAKSIIDIGCGEGHTTKQILDRLKNDDYACDLLEPNKNALLNAEAFLSPENNIGKCYVSTLANFDSNKKYDTVFTSHTNYYWALNQKDFDDQLEKILGLVKPKGKLLILTLPEDSDHYNIAVRQIYPEFNYSEYILDYYKKSGYVANIKKFDMKMYVGDILSTKKRYDLKNFFKFIHNMDTYPTDGEADLFLERIRRFQKNNYLNFKDHLIIIEQK